MSKTIVSINLGNFGSTGTIMHEISKLAEEYGYIAYEAFPDNKTNKPLHDKDIRICSRFTKKISEHLGILTGFNGCFSYFSTMRFIAKLKKIQPDIIHLHNLHGGYIHLPSLFRYLKSNKVSVFWTLHDCWSFTGHCAHFDMVGCERWKNGCDKCPQLAEYPKSQVDRTRVMYHLKKKWFTGVDKMTLVTPSSWLADLVRQSFLNEYSIKVINNGIDLNVFKPATSDFRKKYHCEDKFILLGVAFGWGKYSKGLDVFIELDRVLDKRFQIVLIGTDTFVDKTLPDTIISIHKTHNQSELAKIYSAADLFINPTREENYPTVNMEAIACGTPVLTFQTGGSPEILDDTCGSVIPKDDFEALVCEIKRIQEVRPYSIDDCINGATRFEKQQKYKEYITLYEKDIALE